MAGIQVPSRKAGWDRLWWTEETPRLSWAGNHKAMRIHIVSQKRALIRRELTSFQNLLKVPGVLIRNSLWAQLWSEIRLMSPSLSFPLSLPSRWGHRFAHAPSLWPHLNHVCDLIETGFLLATTHLPSQVKRHWGGYLRAEKLWNPKLAEHWHNTWGCGTPAFLWVDLRNAGTSTLYKIISRLCGKVCRGHQWMPCLDSGSVPIILYYMHAKLSEFQDDWDTTESVILWLPEFDKQGTKHITLYDKPNILLIWSLYYVENWCFCFNIFALCSSMTTQPFLHLTYNPELPAHEILVVGSTYELKAT